MAEPGPLLSPRGSQAWVLRSRDLLLQSEQRLDPAVQSELDRARAGALAAADAAAAGRRRLRAVALAALVAGLGLVLAPLWPGSEVPHGAGATAEVAAPAQVASRPVAAPARASVTPAPVLAPDFELLVDPERYALVEELEFHAWLEAQVDADD